MKKSQSAVLQNAWNQKNKHCHWKNNSGLENPINSYEKTAQHRLTKSLKPKKQILSLKNNSGLKNPINSYEKTAQHRLTKYLKPKKHTLIEKTILALKTL